MWRIAACIASIMVLGGMSCPVAWANYDSFDEETLNDRDSFGAEVPYSGAAAREFTAIDAAGLSPADASERFARLAPLELWPDTEGSP